MRHSKISALIHNSTNHPNLPHCSVEVHFQDVQDKADGITVVLPGSELVVSRKAFRNNSSRYTINGRESSFTEVTTLLKERGIDLDHKRFLILQGEVESIAQMKAKAETEHDDGLLEYLEDIIGTSAFKKAIEEAQTKLDTLNEECVEKTNRLKIVEKEMDGLQDQRDEILKHLSMENEIVHKRSSFLQLNIHLCRSQIELTSKVIQEQSERLQQELSKTQSNKGEVETLRGEVKMKQKEIGHLEKGFSELFQSAVKVRN
jgi:structural maintenance of chromosome 4